MAKRSNTTNTKTRSTKAAAKPRKKETLMEQISSTAHVISEVGEVAGHFANAIEAPPAARKKKHKDPLDHVRSAVVATARMVEKTGKAVDQVSDVVESVDLRIELLQGKVSASHFGPAIDKILKHVTRKATNQLIVVQDGKPVAALVNLKSLDAADASGVPPPQKTKAQTGNMAPATRRKKGKAKKR